MALPGEEAELSSLLETVGVRVEGLQQAAREAKQGRARAEAEAQRLAGELGSVRQQLAALRLQLQAAAEREESQARQIAALTEQLAAAGRDAAAAARAHEDQRQAACTEAGERARQLARAEERGQEAAAEAQRAQNRERELQQDLDALRQQLQGAADVQQLLQHNAALQQQLLQERQEKEAAQQLKSKYKQQAVEISKVYALMKNAYVRLRKEKGGAESGSGRARNAGRSSSRQGSQPDRPPSGLGDADMVGQASDSEEQQGSPRAAGRGRTADMMPRAVELTVTQPQAAGEAEGGQPPLAAGAGQPDSSPAAASAGQPPASPSAAGTGPPEPREQAMPAGVAGEQLAIPTAAGAARPGSSAATGADHPAASPASPTTWTQEASSGAVESEAMQEGVPAAPEPEQLGIRCSAAASPVSHLGRPGTAGEPGSGAALAGVAASAEAAPPMRAAAGAAPPDLAAVETAAADVAAPAVAAVERRPEQQQAAAEPPAPAALAMLPPPPRPHAAAPATSSEVPWRNRQQQQQQQQHNMPVLQPPAQPPDQQQCHLQRNPPSQAPWLEEDTQVTQAGSYRPLHEVLWSPPPQAKGQKRPAPPQPAEPPSRQPAFDTAVAPVWGSPGSQADAAPAGPQLPAGGPAWKKVARPGLADQHDFITAALPGALQSGAPLQQAARRSVPAPPMQQQQAAGSGGAARTAAKENDAAAAAGGQAGSYKYQDVVRKKAEREKLAAVECADCARFFEALQTWGTIRGDQVPHCGHVSVDAALVTREELRQEGGRHRYRYQPPATPQEFWNMDMTP